MNHSEYMGRCLQLAQMGEGYVRPNPMVGALLLHEDRIIGEGYHQQYGEPHAEVNCFNAVAPADKHLIKDSTLYVSLEPCAHWGKTPPCADLIIAQKPARVVIACRDIFSKVNGQGIQKIKDAGIEVVEGVLEKEATALNKRFFYFHQFRLPYIVLKWAQTADGFIARKNGAPLAISNAITNCLVHKMRAQEAAIMVGYGTALHDNPQLSLRHWPGRHPIRIVLDKALRLPDASHIKNNNAPVIIVNAQQQFNEGHIQYVKMDWENNIVPALLPILHQLNVQSVLVEGGQKLLQSFIDTGLWNEAYCITNTSLNIKEGIAAPGFTGKAEAYRHFNIGSDAIVHFLNQQNSGIL